MNAIDTAVRSAGAALVAAALAACGSPPVVHLHSLMPTGAARPADAQTMIAAPTNATTPTPMTSSPSSASPTAPLVFALDPVRLPAQVDQPQWLVQLPDGSLASLEQERWASPLRDEFQQAVLETLIVRYGAVELRHAGDVVAASASALRVAIDVRRFESVPGAEARIEGSWTISGASRSAPRASPPLHCEWFLRERAPGAISALADAHRRAVARLADGIGTAMTSIRRGDVPACPKADTSS